jgi:molecular chaperone GrpE
MTPRKTVELGKDRSDDVEFDGTVDDFIRELEAKEKDLHISSELVIEVSQSEFDDSNLPEFIVEELKSPESKSIEVKTAPPAAHLKTEIADLENTISKFKAERTEILERSRRQMEDFDNFRKRTERERRESFSSQMINLAAQMLPVLDNLNRALDYALAMKPDKRMEIEPFFDGIVLVNQQVNDVLAGMGVQPIAAVGEDFDPNLHEAVATVATDEKPANTVIEELLRGYRIGDRVVRHSMVKVVAAAPAVSAPSRDHVPELETGRYDDFVPSLDGDEPDSPVEGLENGPEETEIADDI